MTLKTSTSTKVFSVAVPTDAITAVSATGALLKFTVLSVHELFSTRRNWPPRLDGSATNNLSFAPVTVLPVPLTVNFRNTISTGELSAFRPVAVP
jgi:hypothetical protein